MPVRRARPRQQLGTVLASLMVAAALVGLTLFAGTDASASPAAARTHGSSTSHLGPKPTIVLVHGAFADASGWADVVTKLTARGFPVLAPANPLRGVASDSAYVASVLATIPGPIVLVAHSYGGEVITNAALGNPNIKALVYIAAYAPAKGESIGSLGAQFPGGLTPANLTFRPYPLPDGTTGQDGYINVSDFRAMFAADLPNNVTSVMAASQRGASASTLVEPSGDPAWTSIPSWYLVAKQDRTIAPAAERFMANRMHAHTIEINSSHVAMMSHPEIVTDLILRAVRSQG